jgi:hypothetical protein
MSGMIRLISVAFAALLAAVDPFHPAPGTKATVLLFVSSTCPVSNRYAPDFRRLSDEYSKAGVAFWLIYPDPADTDKDIHDHTAEFKLPGTPIRDVTRALVKRAGATITPEAAVYDAGGTLTYRGRIDDRYSAVGIERAAATRHDLQDAIAATLAGKPIKDNRTQAVGCYIADFTN